ncbi:hypothetical protein Tco_1095897 [Tanacetum coccineum]
MFKDLKKFQDELEKRNDANYMLKVELECAKAKAKLMSYKTESQKSINNYSYQISDLNQKIFDMKKELVAHQETISIMSQQKEDQTKTYKTREEKELEKVIALENKIKVLDDIVYKTGCYNDNLDLMLAPESDETIRLAQESRSKLSDLIRPFDYNNLNNLYDLFIPQREKSSNKKIFQKEEMVADLRYFNSLEHEVDSLKSQLETQKTQFLNEINRLSKEYYYADHINAILGVYNKLDEVTNLKCDYLEALEKCQSLENEVSKRNTTSKSFEALQQHAINLELAL